jgi:structural maintenance of chromosome 2
MYIIEIIIDGFKSYSSRTNIDNFDPSFNAITGLNGSGKSNILDAICFVMGISRFSLIRVDKI